MSCTCHHSLQFPFLLPNPLARHKAKYSLHNDDRKYNSIVISSSAAALIRCQTTLWMTTIKHKPTNRLPDRPNATIWSTHLIIIIFIACSAWVDRQAGWQAHSSSTNPIIYDYCFFIFRSHSSTVFYQIVRAVICSMNLQNSGGRYCRYDYTEFVDHNCKCFCSIEQQARMRRTYWFRIEYRKQSILAQSVVEFDFRVLLYIF